MRQAGRCRVGLALLSTLVLVGAIGLRGAQAEPAVPAAPLQPVAFSHRFHVTDLGLDCSDCHVNPDAGRLMTYPATSVCMSCHTRIAATSVSLQRLAAFAAAGKPIPWVRVYQVPDFVYWRHGPHLAAGVTCEMCHGPVRDRDVISRETEVTTMRGCQSCHEARQVLTDCGDCHEPRQ